jgi:hypothetical protein
LKAEEEANAAKAAAIEAKNTPVEEVVADTEVEAPVAEETASEEATEAPAEEAGEEEASAE